MNRRRILVIQLARLGDLVQTRPLLKRLRQIWPTGDIDILGEGSLQELAPLIPELDTFHSLDLPDLAGLAQFDMSAAYRRVHTLVEKLRAQAYDEVYNLNYSRKSLLLSYLLGAPVKGYQPVCGGREFYRGPWLAYVFGLVHGRPFNRWHLSDVFRHLAPLPLVPTIPFEDIQREDGSRLTAQGFRSINEPIIALQLATRHPKRTWPLDYFRRLAVLLIKRLGGFIWLLGSGEERPLGDRLMTALPAVVRHRVINFQGQTSLTELAARLKASHLLVSGDTGTLHLAASLGVSTLALFFGPASCFETGPYAPGHYVLQAEPPCHPCLEADPGCGEPFCPAMVPPDSVAQLILSLFGLGQTSGELNLPTNTRLYCSHRDKAGTIYEPVPNDCPRFRDLVGWAYRRTGEFLLSNQEATSAPRFTTPTPATCGFLDQLLTFLGNGADPDRTPPMIAAALKPLWAFRAELRRQARCSRDDGEAEVLYQKIKSTLTHYLENCLAGSDSHDAPSGKTRYGSRHNFSPSPLRERESEEDRGQ